MNIMRIWRAHFGPSAPKTVKVELTSRELAVIVLSQSMDNQAVAKRLGITLAEERNAFMSGILKAVNAAHGEAPQT